MIVSKSVKLLKAILTKLHRGKTWWCSKKHTEMDYVTVICSLTTEMFRIYHICNSPKWDRSMSKNRITSVLGDTVYIRIFVFDSHQINKTDSFSLTDLWFSVRLRWRLMSSKASLRKVSLLTSCCWHWSNTCSMHSMYCGVHLFSSSRDFSYFSLAWDRDQRTYSQLKPLC